MSPWLSDKKPNSLTNAHFKRKTAKENKEEDEVACQNLYMRTNWGQMYKANPYVHPIGIKPMGNEHNNYIIINKQDLIFTFLSVKRKKKIYISRLAANPQG